MATYWEIAAHSAYDMCSWYKYLVVYLVFIFFSPRFLEWEFNLILIAPFPDRCLVWYLECFAYTFRIVSCQNVVATGNKKTTFFSAHAMYVLSTAFNQN